MPRRIPPPVAYEVETHQLHSDDFLAKGSPYVNLEDLMTINFTSEVEEDVLITFNVTLSAKLDGGTNQEHLFKMYVDGESYARIDAHAHPTADLELACAALSYVKSGLAAGSHTVKIRWAIWPNVPGAVYSRDLNVLRFPVS